MALRRERMRLGDLLIKQNVLTEDELKKALALQKGSGKKIGEVLVDNGFITEDMIVRALQMQLGLKVVQLTGVTIRRKSEDWLVSICLRNTLVFLLNLTHIMRISFILQWQILWIWRPLMISPL